MNILKIRESRRIEILKVLNEHNIESLADVTVNTTKEKHIMCVNLDGYFISVVIKDIVKTNKLPSRFTKTNPRIIENIRLFLKLNNRSISLLSNSYKGAQHKMDWTCNICNHKWKTAWSGIRSGNGCYKCSGSYPLNILEVKKRMSDINKNIEILSIEYNGAKEPLHCKCKECGNEWFPRWYNLQNGTNCPPCSFSKSTGGYSEKSIERNKILYTNKKAYVYILKCYGHGETFYKIGITTTSVKRRFGSKQLPYDYIVIKTIETNLYDGFYLEKFLHDENKANKYRPEKHFGGHTECFSILKGGSYEQ